MPGQSMDYEFHPDFMCLKGYCRRCKPTNKIMYSKKDESIFVFILDLLPGEFGCVEDIQCNTKCKESHCAKEPYYQSIYGEYQCRCNSNFDNTTMYLYADKCCKLNLLEVRKILGTLSAAKRTKKSKITVKSRISAPPNKRPGALIRDQTLQNISIIFVMHYFNSFEWILERYHLAYPIFTCSF